MSSRPEIVFRSRGVWVLNKPAGWLSHDAGQGGPDLVSWTQRQRGGRGFSLAHRLDRQASGLLIGSSDPEILRWLSTALQSGRIEKKYLVMVHGLMRRKGMQRRPLVDSRRGRELPCTTRYRCLAHLQQCSLLEVEIEGGRKHQIRRHLAGMGFPVLGETRYFPPRMTRPKRPLQRLWLHAYTLREGERLWTAPPPGELRRHLESLGADLSQSPWQS